MTGIDVGARLAESLASLARRGLTRVIGFGRRPAVLVVDFIKAFTDTTMPLAADLVAEIDSTALVLKQARAARVPVYFTTIIYDDTDLADAGVWAIKVPALVTLKAGTPGIEVDDRLGRTAADGVIVKKYASAFFGTDLSSRLTANGVDTVIVCGCTTSGCVRASVVDGLQHGYRMMVVRDAVGDRDPDAHIQSLIDMQQKYGDVVTAVQVDDYLRSLEVWK